MIKKENISRMVYGWCQLPLLNFEWKEIGAISFLLSNFPPFLLCLLMYFAATFLLNS